MRQAQVYYKNEFAGIIRETDEEFCFNMMLPIWRTQILNQ